MTDQKKKIYATTIDEYGVVDSSLIPSMLCTGGSYLIIDEFDSIEAATNQVYVVNAKAPEGVSEQEKWQKLKQQKEFRKMCKRGR